MSGVSQRESHISRLPFQLDMPRRSTIRHSRSQQPMSASFLFQLLHQGTPKQSAAPVDVNSVVPDSVCIQSVSIEGDNSAAVGDRIGPDEEWLQDAASLAASDVPAEYRVSDRLWRDNRITIGGSNVCQKAAALIRGPGGIYQVTYRAYCCCSAIGIGLGTLAILMLAVLLGLTGHWWRLSLLSSETAAVSKRRMTWVATAATAAATGAVLCVVAALLARAGAAYHFACRCDVAAAIANAAAAATAAAAAAASGAADRRDVEGDSGGDEEDRNQDLADRSGGGGGAEKRFSEHMGRRF